ncbi:MAG: tyrosine-type recombinase/integrase [Bacteroidota bacterium]
MKHLPIKTPAFQYVEKSFKEWLDILGYAPQSVYYKPLFIREMLHYMENNGTTELRGITIKKLQEYYRQLKLRPNVRRGGALSSGSLNLHLCALYNFTDYLRQSGRLELSYLNIRTEERDTEEVTALTQEEIQQLYKACDSGNLWQEKYDLRDRAMLTMLYGCGLRRNEAYHLDVGDIDIERLLVYVRKGKNYKQRYVPIGKTGMNRLQDYIYEGRPLFLKGWKSDALFISHHATRMQGQSMLHRLKLLIVRTGNEALMEKEVGLHTLRHSIATHLLENGMDIESIARFLGHSSLESTQIYTHLVESGQDEAPTVCGTSSLPANNQQNL